MEVELKGNILASHATHVRMTPSFDNTILKYNACLEDPRISTRRVVKNADFV